MRQRCLSVDVQGPSRRQVIAEIIPPRCWAALPFALGLLLSHPIQTHAQVAPAFAPAVPYSLPVVLPPPRTSPPEDPAAPYTPTVVSLIRQLEAHTPPTPTELRTAAALLTTHGGTYAHPEGSNPTCHNLANVNVKAATTPRITPLCFSDGLGINVDSGPNIGHTTGLPSMLMLASSFDRELANAMGQVEGREGRNLMVTGLLGPQADTDVFINWQRGHHTSGEDPFLNGVMSAAQINGIQGQGLMAQVKHYTVYHGAGGTFTDVQDQALHELLLTPYELALKDGGASSIMCSYQKFRDASPFLNKDVDVLSQPSPFHGASPRTWRLNEVHFACENPLILTYVLRDQWKSNAFVASDYGGVHSSHGFLQGDDREDPTESYFGAINPEGISRDSDRGIDSTSSTCADAAGNKISCNEAAAVHVAGIPGPGCPATGCGIVEAVLNGTIPLSVFNQALARVLYQEERFGLLGCDNGTIGCNNPGGMGSDRTGLAPLSDGAQAGPPQLGSKNGDAAISERVAEEGAVLLKNEKDTLPISADDLRRGIAVSGPGAEYLVANPNNEGSAGFSDRNAVSPLHQLRILSGSAAAFTYTPANSPTGQPVPCGVLSSLSSHESMPSNAPAKICSKQSGLQRSSGNTMDTLANDRVDGSIDYSVATGQLKGGRVYRWDGWIYIPISDSYVFRMQHSTALTEDNIRFSIDGSLKTLVDSGSFYHGSWYGGMAVPTATTNAGYVEAGMRNVQCAVLPERGARPSQVLVPCSSSPAIGWHKVTLTVDASGLAGSSDFSLRFAFSRKNGDIADAAKAAEGKALALVFVDDEARNVVPNSPALSSLTEEQLQLIHAVAAKNPNTVVVINTGEPFVVKEWIADPNVKAVLNMWQAGQEGGTTMARLLLGQANPSGHLTMTWPKESTDTIEGYNQLRGLYPGDTAGTHPERVGVGESPSVESQGIFSGYRYYDELEIPVQFPFGYGLSYTRFKYSGLRLTRKEDGAVTVSFTVMNAGRLAGAAVPQVYVGPGPAIDGVQQAVRSLRGFERVSLDPGQAKQLTLTLDPRSFQYWSESQQSWMTDEGTRTIFVGDADATESLPLSGSITVARQNE